MSIQDLKFVSSDFTGKDISGLPDRPGDAGMTAAQLKARFDEIGKAMIALGSFNDLIDALSAATGAGEIGGSVSGLSGNNVSALLTALKAYEDAHRGLKNNPHTVTKAQVGLGNADNTSDAGKPVSTAQQAALDLKVDKVAGKGLSTNDYSDSEKAIVAQVQDKANISDVLTKTNATAYTPTEDYHPCTKAYADNIAASAGAVTSVFGRAGAVTAQSGDYTAEQVGAASADSVAKIIDGTTTVGNAAKLGGVAAGNYPRALTVTGTDLLTWAAAQTTGGDFSVNSAVTSGVPATSYWSGLLETRDGSTCRIILTRRVSPYDTYVNIGSGGTWNGWVNVADGGDANRLQGYAPTVDGKKGVPVVNTNYGTMEVGYAIDFHTADNQDYAFRISNGAGSSATLTNNLNPAQTGYIVTSTQRVKISVQSSTPSSPNTGDLWAY